MVDLMAAVPSIVYGLWGYLLVMPHAGDLAVWLQRHLGWLPFFDVRGADPDAAVVDASRYVSSSFCAGIAVAMMVLPMACAVMRQVFSQTPQGEKEAALALGATRWEMIRMAVFPYSRSGITSAVMLGLGRALGETMAVAMVLSAAGVVTFNLISSQNPSTIAANIALNYANASGTKTNVLIAGGLVLFVVTFAVNFLGRWLAAAARPYFHVTAADLAALAAGGGRF